MSATGSLLGSSRLPMLTACNHFYCGVQSYLYLSVRKSHSHSCTIPHHLLSTYTHRQWPCTCIKLVIIKTVFQHLSSIPGPRAKMLWSGILQGLTTAATEVQLMSLEFIKKNSKLFIPCHHSFIGMSHSICSTCIHKKNKANYLLAQRQYTIA